MSWVKKLQEFVFGGRFTEEEKDLINDIKDSNQTLRQCGGEMYVSGKGAMHLRFDTKEGEKRYYRLLREKFNSRAQSAGFDGVEDFIQKSNLKER